MTKEDKLRIIKPNYSKLNIYSISDVKRHHDGHWFSPETMRFFSSKVSDVVYPGVENVFFVSSEQFKSYSFDCPRKFTVRKFNIKTKDINTVGEFNEIESRKIAHSIALQLAYEETIKNK